MHIRKQKKKFSWSQRINSYSYRNKLRESSGNGFLIFAGYIVCLAIFVVLVVNIKVQKIECLSNDGECDTELQTVLSSSVNKKYFYARTQIEHALKKSLLVDTFSIRTTLPLSLEVAVVEKEVLGVLRNQDEIGSFVDINGYVFKKVKIESSVNQLILPKDIPDTGAKVDEKINFSLLLIRDLSKLTQNSVSGVYTSDGIIIEYKEIDYLLPNSGDLKRIAGAFSLVERQLNTSPSDSTMKDTLSAASFVDLRFKDAIVK